MATMTNKEVMSAINIVSNKINSVAARMDDVMHTRTQNNSDNINELGCEITDLDLNVLESELQITDLDLRVMELEFMNEAVG